MAVHFSVPASPEKYTYRIEEFRGVDFFNASVNVEPYRSPDALNMIRDEVGKVRKRMGYQTRYQLDGRINGFYQLGEQKLIHAGTKLYCFPMIGKTVDFDKMSVGASGLFKTEASGALQSYEWYNSDGGYDETIVKDGTNALYLDGTVKEIHPVNRSVMSPISNVKGFYRGFRMDVCIEQLDYETNDISVATKPTGSISFSIAPQDDETYTINGGAVSYGVWYTLAALVAGDKVNSFVLDADGNIVHEFLGQAFDKEAFTRMLVRHVARLKLRNLEFSNVLSAPGKSYYPDGRTEFSDYREYISVYDGMNDERSVGIPFGDRLYVMDGKTYLVFDSNEVKPVSEDAYIPTVIIGRSPNGGGTPYESINLLQKKWKEMFLSDGESYTYQLTAADLDDTEVVCEILQSDGTWQKKYEEKDFTVDRENGTVHFKDAPGKPLVTGMDNVRITASKVRNGYAERINQSTTGILYGVGGTPDRLFVGGNKLCPNMDYYSEYNDLTYFGDTSYSTLGQESCELMGYSILNNQLAAFLKGNCDGRNIVLRSGRLDNDGATAVFPVENTIVADEAVGKYTFCYLEKDPLYLSNTGIYAVATELYTNWKNSQLRSMFLSLRLEREPDLKDAFAFVFRDFYLLALNGKVYILDGKQRVYDKNAPFSSYQYECYFWDNVPARVMWEEDGALWFGTNDGSLCRFYTNVDSIHSYNDNGDVIHAYWETPDLDGRLFFKNKTFRYIAVRLAAAAATGIEIFAQKRGIWNKIFDAGAKARYLDWENINFAKFSFSSDRTPRTVGGKIKLKKVDKAKFRLQNNELNEPFGLSAFALEYTEPGNNYKG